MRATTVLMARAPVLMRGLTFRLVVSAAPYERDFDGVAKNLHNICRIICHLPPSVLNIGVDGDWGCLVGV